MKGNGTDGALRRQEIADEDGDRFTVQVCEPADGPAEHAVLLMPPIFGVNDYVSRRAQQLAASGYMVIVVDYFSRDVTQPDLSTPEQIGAAVASVDDRRVLQDVGRVSDWLANLSIPRERTAVLGFCIGATHAILCAGLPSAPRCAVAYYGQLRYAERTERKPFDPMSIASELRAPLLGHFGDMDRLIDAQEIADFTAALRGSQRHHELHLYRGASHAFDEWHRPAVFRPVASSEAWDRTLLFLEWHLRERLPTRLTPRFTVNPGD